MNNDQTKEHHDAGATVLKIERAPRVVRRREQLMRRKQKRKQYAHPDKFRAVAKAMLVAWPRKVGGERSKYRPHQGLHELMRRVFQMQEQQP